MARSATPRASRPPKAPEAAPEPAPAPASDAVLEAAPSPLDHDRDGELGGSLPDGFRWSEEAEHGEAHAPFILGPTGARVADTAEDLRALLDGGLADLVAPVLDEDSQPLNPPEGDLAADVADATAGRNEPDEDASAAGALSLITANVSGSGEAGNIRPEFDPDILAAIDQFFEAGHVDIFRPAFVGQTVLFREHARRFKGAPTTPAIITWVYDDLVVDLTVLPRGDVPYPREAVPYEQTLEEDGLGRAWSFINI